MPILATKTVAMIDQMIYADQGAAFRQLLEKVIPTIKDAYEGKKDDFRSHLGASLIGRECARELWYNFYWAKAPKFEGRMIRLFNRGHLEEARFVAMLQMIGCQVYATDGKGGQYRISGVGGHYGSALDGVITGCPDVPNKPILGEFKTHNAKSFAKLKSSGVQAAKFEHYVQMQQYMGEYKLECALYLAVNKDDDELYGEIVPFDAAIYEMYKVRARRIILADTIPNRINDSPGFWKCKYCDFKDICHRDDQPAMNCRTCAGSVPTDDGKWQCIKFNVELGKPAQLVGCKEYDKRIEFVSK